MLHVCTLHNTNNAVAVQLQLQYISAENKAKVQQAAMYIMAK